VGHHATAGTDHPKALPTGDAAARPVLATRLHGLGTTIFAEMSALATATGSINLGQGFPDTDGPASVAEGRPARSSRAGGISTLRVRASRNCGAPSPSTRPRGTACTSTQTLKC
jgi:hypothetical protein